MNALGYALVFGTLAGFIALLALWLVAENRWSKRLRITLGLLAILTAIPVTALVAVAVSQLDDQSYYAASVQTLLDETVVALESGEPGFLHRLKTFQEKQMLTYESRSNLLENARAFRDDGQALRSTTEKTLKEPNASSSSDHAIALSDIRALLEAGRDAKSLPARIVVRLDANAGDSDSRLKETWEFSSGQVHRVVIDESKGPARYRRERTLAFDTRNICRQLLDGKLFRIEAAEGTGKTRMFAGTAFEGGVGDRAIEILIDGESAVWVGESCVFAGLPETDALAFNALYEQLASQARAAFGALGVQAAGNATQIAVSVLDAEHGGIYVLNADGSGEQRLTKGSTDILPRWSPDGKQIAFLALREQDHELAAEHDLAFHWFLYVMDADGQNQRRVTKTPIGMIFQWSPDGSRFVFQSSCEDGNNKAKDGTVSSAIYVMKADGTKQKRLTPVEKNDGFPSWSPDGKQIAFCSNRHGNMDIFVMNADGSDVRRLTSNNAKYIGPTWSPDGKQIAFASSRESGNAHVMNADGTQESPLIVRGRPVAWSPDGQSLLLENDGQLVLSGADGRNPKELTKAGEPALDGEYSPNGKAVFYRSKVNGTWTLMSVDTERSSPKRIWSDSGKFLGFSVSPSRVSLAEDSIPLSTSNPHLTEFGNACRKSEKLYDDSRQQLFALIPDFLDWKRREIEIPYSSTTNAFEVRVIFSPPDGTKAHVAVLVSGNRHLVENKKVDISEVDPAIVWGASTILTEAEYGRYDGHLLKQAAFVLEGNLADKDALDAYLESVDFKRIGKFVSSRLTRNAK